MITKENLLYAYFSYVIMGTRRIAMPRKWVEGARTVIRDGKAEQATHAACLVRRTW
jgi:hypothetical protein